MGRWDPIVAVFAGIAVLWGFGSAFVADAAGCSPLLAPASTIVVLAVFGWTRRGRDVVDVIGPAIAVSYAAYVGLAIERVSQPNMLAMQWWLAPLVDRWPAVLYAGIPFALIFTVFVAIPIALIPVRRKSDTAAHERFWAFVKEQNDARIRPIATERTTPIQRAHKTSRS